MVVFQNNAQKPMLEKSILIQCPSCQTVLEVQEKDFFNMYEMDTLENKEKNTVCLVCESDIILLAEEVDKAFPKEHKEREQVVEE